MLLLDKYDLNQESALLLIPKHLDNLFSKNNVVNSAKSSRHINHGECSKTFVVKSIQNIISYFD